MLIELIEGARSISTIGMCKNAGKTTVLNRLISELGAANVTLGLTSIGRDGESVDVVTNTRKPGIFVREGTLIATGADMLRLSDITREILCTTGINTPLGEVAVVRAKSDGFVQLAGPSMTVQLAALSEEFFSFGADKVLIDGALSRKTLCAPAVSEATILCTGASCGKDMNGVIEATAYAAELLTLEGDCFWAEALADGTAGAKVLLAAEGRIPWPAGGDIAESLRDKENDEATRIYVSGALTDAGLKPLLMSNVKLAGRTFTVYDGSKLLISRDIYEKLLVRGARITVLHTTRLAAVTVNPVSAYGFDFDKDEFRGRMAGRLSVPVIDVGRNG